MPETKMMNTERGGEQTQYEGAVTENVAASKQTGQLGGDSTHSSEQQPVSKARGEQTAANIRYGQGISEQGMGGMTTTSTGQAQQSGYGGAKADTNEEDIKAGASRRGQGYSGGSGVGG